MRCSYCGGLNTEQAQFCVRCGRNIAMQTPPVQTPAPRQRVPYPPSQPPQSSQRPYPAPRQVPPASGYPQPTQMPATPAPQRPSTPPVGRRPATQPAAVEQRPAAKEPPAPFPPRTLDHLKALEEGALEYRIIEETESIGRKHVVRILYAQCAPWQQMATLMKALKEQRSDRFDTVIIQGSYTQERAIYGFTNGQLQFDRNVRLGSQIMNRYQVETGNGFEVDAVRVVLSE